MFERQAERDVKAIHRRSPRMPGVYLFLIGIGFFVANLAMMQLIHRFVDKLFLQALPSPLWAFGFW